MIIDEWRGGANSALQFHYRVRWTGDDYVLEYRLEDMPQMAFTDVAPGTTHYAAYRLMCRLIPDYEEQRKRVSPISALGAR